MDRAEAGVHYLTHVDDALDTVLKRCQITYGAAAAEQVSRGLTDVLFRENLLSYCDINEVFSLWGVISRKAVTDKTYLAEFIIALHQQFSFMVEPPVMQHNPNDQRVSLESLTPLGRHLAVTIGVDRPNGTPAGSDPHVEAPVYSQYMVDIPDRSQIARILATFPWMAPLYLLSLSLPTNVTGTLSKYVIEKGNTGAPGNE